MHAVYAIYDDAVGPILGTLAFEPRTALIKGINYMDSNEFASIYDSDDIIKERFERMSHARGGHLYLANVIIQLAPAPKTIPVITKRKIRSEQASG